jgi:hypothetical protein
MSIAPAYPKRLIEVDLPIRRISDHAQREKPIRHGRISTLHIWCAASVGGMPGSASEDGTRANPQVGEGCGLHSATRRMGGGRAMTGALGCGEAAPK